MLNTSTCLVFGSVVELLWWGLSIEHCLSVNLHSTKAGQGPSAAAAEGGGGGGGGSGGGGGGGEAGRWGRVKTGSQAYV